LFSWRPILRQIGYSALGREKVYYLKPDGDEKGITDTGIEEVQKDIKESFEVGREDDPVMPNIWYPDDVLPGFKDACLDFFWVGVSFKTGLDIMTQFSK